MHDVLKFGEVGNYTYDRVHNVIKWGKDGNYWYDRVKALLIKNKNEYNEVLILEFLVTDNKNDIFCHNYQCKYHIIG